MVLVAVDTPPALKAKLPAGVALLNKGDGQAAIAYFRALLTQFPDHPECLDYLATALIMTQQYAEADAVYRRCFDVGGRFPESLGNAARNAARLRRFQHQLDYAQQLLALEGDMRLEGLRQSAEALASLKRPVEALAACRQFLLEKPDDLPIQGVMVRQMLEMGMADSALAVCNRLIPSHPDNQSLLMARVEACFVGGDLSGGFEHARQVLDLDPDNLSALSALGFYYQYDPQISVAARREHARRVGQVIRRNMPEVEPWWRDKPAAGPLRVGLITADLRQHPVGYFMLGLMRALQQSSLSFAVYDPQPKHDGLTEQFRLLVDVWHDVAHLDDAALAAQIRADEVDILLDIQGFMTANRLPVYALRPAPLQLSWMGFQGTTGAPGLDYVLVDPFCVPPGAEEEFEEQVWRLPENTLCFTEPEFDVPLVPPPALSNGFVTFGSLNNPDKYNDRVLQLWARVLRAVPGSRLLLRGSKFNSREYRRRFLQRLQAAGMDLLQITIEGPVKREEFLRTYNRIDISLDPFPYSGATTTAEALWAGTPVLCLRGDRMVWRMAHSMLRACGMQDWLAADEDDFVALAVRKAADLQGLAALRAAQRRRVLDSALFDAQRFAGQFEATLRELWRWGR